VLQVIALQLTRCQSGGGSGGGGGGSGGPHIFGYDASSSCTKPYSRAGRAHYEDLPCDFRRQNWCSVAGSSYPWYFIHLSSSLPLVVISFQDFRPPDIHTLTRV